MEEWKKINDYPNYSVSNKGNVRNDKTTRILNLSINGKGYNVVCLYRKGRHTLNVHMIEAIAFLNHNPIGHTGLIVDHKDKNPLNNNLKNLQLISQRENLSKDRNVLLGAFKRKNKWESSIRIERDQVYLGLYSTQKEANLIYKAALLNITKYEGNKKEFRRLIQELKPLSLNIETLQ
jgi:hypothetical protein